MLLVLASCGSSSSTNVTAPTTAQCAVTLTSNSLNMGATGGDGALTIDVNRECSWTAKPDVDWITLTSTGTGQGGATVNFRVAANPGASSRRGGIGVNDRRVDVTQAGAPCTYSLSRTDDAIDAAGGRRTILVTAGPSCAWTAKSNAAWITVSAGASGTGSGSVTIDVAQNTGLERSGTVVIAGQIYTLLQTAAGAPGPDCTFSLSSASQSVGAAGGQVSLTVLAGGGCGWTATSHAPWLTISAGASGAGDGAVQITVAANGSSAARTGTATIAGQTFTINQSGLSSTPCTFSLSATSQSVGASSTTSSVNVITDTTCAWSATANVPWLSITAGAPGTGNGTVQFTVAANTDSTSRQGTLTVAGQTFTVTQSGASATPCTYSLSATTQSVGASSTTGSVGVTTGTSCAWSASANVPWLSITAGASGTGNGTVQFTVAANTDPAPRAGTLTVAGQTFTVKQAAGSVSCAYSLSSTSVSAPAAAGSSSVDITTTSSCAWTAAANASWLAVTSAASGTGNATVSFSIAENTDTSPRSGTLTIAGQTVTVNQAAAAPPTCSYTVAPLTIPAGSGAGSSSVAVTTTSTCTWTATSNDSWLTLTGATSGTGNGTVAIGIGANPDPSSRSGTLTVAGQTVTVNQDPAPCTFSLSDTTLSIVAAGEDKTIHVTASSSSCGWTASSDQPSWMIITSGASGTGSGDVVVHFDANTDPTQRTGTLTIGGHTVSVTQDAGP